MPCDPAHTVCRRARRGQRSTCASHPQARLPVSATAARDKRRGGWRPWSRRCADGRSRHERAADCVPAGRFCPCAAPLCALPGPLRDAGRAAAQGQPLDVASRCATGLCLYYRRSQATGGVTAPAVSENLTDMAPARCPSVPEATARCWTRCGAGAAPQCGHSVRYRPVLVCCQCECSRNE